MTMLLAVQLGGIVGRLDVAALDERGGERLRGGVRLDRRGRNGAANEEGGAREEHGD